MIYWQLFVTFFRFSLISFGGVFGVLPELERDVVQRYHWVTHDQFIQSFVVGQFVPGPNMAMCPLIGYTVAGVLGGAAAFVGIYLGPLLVMGLTFAIYGRWRQVVWVRRVELSLRPIVLGLIGAAAVTLFWQQASGHLIGGFAIGATGIYLYGKRGVGALTVFFSTGILWWLWVTVFATPIMRLWAGI